MTQKNLKSLVLIGIFFCISQIPIKVFSSTQGEPSPTQCIKISDYRPSDYIHIYYSVEVYKEDGGTPLPDWEVLQIYPDKDKNGYFGVAYLNAQKKHIIIAHRGTEDLKDWKTNVDLITSHLSLQEASCMEFVGEIIKKYGNSYTYSFTGHSLGGWLAQVSLWKYHFEFVNKNLGFQDGFAVTLDNPGSGELLEALQPRVEKDYRIDVQSLDITSYLSYPNLVNITMGHEGTVYALFPEIQGLSWLEEFPLMHTFKTHDKQVLLKEFSVQKGKPEKYRRVVDWPRIEWSRNIWDFLYQLYRRIVIFIRKGINQSKNNYITNAKFFHLSKSVLSLKKEKIEKSEYEGFVRYTPGAEIDNYGKLTPEAQFQLKHGIHYNVEEIDEKILPLRNMPKRMKDFLIDLEKKGMMGDEDRVNFLNEKKKKSPIQWKPTISKSLLNNYTINENRKEVISNIDAYSFRNNLLQFLNCNPIVLIGEGLFGFKPVRYTWDIPKHFLEPSSAIDEIEKALQQKNEKYNPIVNLIGYGGAGKTSLAHYYGKNHQEKFDVVFGLNAETNQTLISSFQALAYELIDIEKTNKIEPDTRLKIELDNILKRSPREREKQLTGFIKSLLIKRKNWLLVFDNIENFDLIDDLHIHESILWGRGNIIVTARDTSPEEGSKHGKNIELKEVTDDYKYNLFIKIITNDQNISLPSEKTEKIRGFLKKIPSWPLDIALAACYIKNKIKNNIGSDIENIEEKELSEVLDTYIQNLNQCSDEFTQQQIRDLQKIGKVKYNKTRHTIITLSLKEMINKNSDFKHLLLFICLLDSQNIPLDLLKKYRNKDIDDFVIALKEQGLVTNLHNHTLSVHREIQAYGLSYLLSLQNIIDIKPQERAFKEFYFVERVNNFEISHILLPQLKTYKINILKHKILETDEINPIIDFIIGDIYLNVFRQFIDAKKYLDNLIEENQITKLDSNEQIRLLENLANINVELGNNSETIRFAKLALDKIIDKKSITCARILNVIARAYGFNDFLESKRNFDEVFDIINDMEEKEDVLKLKLESYTLLGLTQVLTYIQGSLIKEGIETIKKAIYYVERKYKFPLCDNKIDSPPSKEFIFEFVKQLIRLGDGLCQFGAYREAKIYFDKANEIARKDLKKYSNNLLVARINRGYAEIDLFNNHNPKDIEVILNEILKTLPIYFSTPNLFTTKTLILRAQTRILMKNSKGAIEDINNILQSKHLLEFNNYLHFIYALCHYHLAYIYFKTGENKKCHDHFLEFFKKLLELSSLFNKLGISRKDNMFLKSLVDVQINEETIKNLSFNNSENLRKSHQILKFVFGDQHPFYKMFVE